MEGSHFLKWVSFESCYGGHESQFRTSHSLINVKCWKYFLKDLFDIGNNEKF